MAKKTAASSTKKKGKSARQSKAVPKASAGGRKNGSRKTSAPPESHASVQGGSALEDLREVLSAIPEAEWRTPNMPIAEAFQEAQDLAAFLGVQSTAQALLAVGLEQERLDGLVPALDAAREAQSRWIVLRDHSKKGAQKEREEAGKALRTHMSAAIRWNLRRNAVALATLELIQEGDSLADLVQDLRDLAHLLNTRQEAFALDSTFDAPAVAAQAQGLADAISLGLSSELLEEEQDQARRLRDQAFTHLDRHVDDIREAGRYAFRNDPETRRAFASAYNRRNRQLRKPAA